MNVSTFTVRGDENGSLIALEEGGEIPFTIKRIYYIFGTKRGVVRGRHAHKKLEQILICVSGSCTIILDDGESRESLTLDTPAKGLYIGPGTWREMIDFSINAVLLVIASENYSESDYIRNYDDFLISKMPAEQAPIK